MSKLKFNKQQEEAINTIEGNLSVIATAGSGKSTVLVYRIKNMIEHGVNPYSILAITFSRKAKDNIIQKLSELNTENVNVETFHSFALKIIHSAYGANRFKVWSIQWEREKMIQDICTGLGLCSQDDVPFNDIFSFIALQKINMIKPQDKLILINDLPFENSDMKKIYFMYEEEKSKKLYIEFDDFLNMANEIFDTNAEILKTYKNHFKYVLVDEFQDVSMSQSLLLKKLNDNNTMIVGDPLQAIYSFRGGDNKYILNFDTDYKDTKVINLNTNYRCSNDIVTTSNKLAQSIPDSKHKNYVKSIAEKDKYKVPELRHFFDEYDEAEWIAEKITKLKGEGYKYSDISILARTNAQLQKLESVLHDANINFDIVDGKLFTDLPEIKLVISYLRLSVYENDNQSFRYIYNKPCRWLNKKFLEEVEENSIRRNVSLYSSMFTIDRRNWRFKNGIDEIFEVINYLQNKKHSNVGDLVHYLRERLDIDKFVTKCKQSDDGKYTEQIDNLDSFENICKKYTTVKELLKYLDDLKKVAELNNGDNVKLLTIHKSKGMEYPVVFIVGCNEELLPHYKNDNVNDEKRLFYVAITRAEKELYLSYVDMYNNKTKKISSFISDIEDTLNVIKQKSNK